MLPDTAGSPAGTMKLVGGDPSLDFVNTVGGRLPEPRGVRTRVRDDKLASYRDLVAFGLHRGLLNEPLGRGLLRRGRARPRAARAALDRALVFREALHRTLRATMTGGKPFAPDIKVLNAEILAGRQREALAAGGRGLRWEWEGPADALEAPLWPVARAASELLTSGELVHLRLCGGDNCGWLFIDHSRNRRRRWCTMEDCGNLAKVRRFRRRHSRR